MHRPCFAAAGSAATETRATTSGALCQQHQQCCCVFVNPVHYECSTSRSSLACIQQHGNDSNGLCGRRLGRDLGVASSGIAHAGLPLLCGCRQCSHNARAILCSSGAICQVLSAACSFCQHMHVRHTRQRQPELKSGISSHVCRTSDTHQMDPGLPLAGVSRCDCLMATISLSIIKWILDA